MEKIHSYGNSTEDQYYSYRHNPVSKGTHYYRLWQFDFDGTNANLGLAQDRQTTKRQVNVYPNPVAAGQVLTLEGLALEEEVDCFLVNLTGQRFDLTSEDRYYNLPAQIPAGLYFLNIVSSSEQQTLPLQIQ